MSERAYSSLPRVRSTSEHQHAALAEVKLPLANEFATAAERIALVCSRTPFAACARRTPPVRLVALTRCTDTLDVGCKLHH